MELPGSALLHQPGEQPLLQEAGWQQCCCARVRGKEQSQQNKILLRAPESFAQSITRELPGLSLAHSHTGTAVGSFPCPWGFVKGGFC